MTNSANNMDFCKKALLISNSANASLVINNTLKKQGIDIETSYINLHSIQSIRENLKANGNTSFIRTDLSKFFREFGYPHMIILDYMIDFSLSDLDDPDHRKVLRTLLISYIILSRAEEINNLKGNFLIVGNESQMDEIQLLEDKPFKVLDILMTNNVIVNSFIEEMRKNPTIYKDLFSIKGINSDLTTEKIGSQAEKFISEVKEINK